MQKLVALSQDNPEIKIVQQSNEIIYKYENYNENNSYFSTEKEVDKNKTKKDFKNISPDFRLFFTYSPDNEETKINQDLFTNCFIFTLSENDSTFEYSTQISYGLFRKAKFNKEISKELSIRIAQIHQEVKKEIANNPNYFSTKMQFSGRTIIFICNYLIKNISQLHKIDFKKVSYYIVNSFNIFYWNCFINTEKLLNFKNNILKNFKKEPTINFNLEKDEIESSCIEIKNLKKSIIYYLNNKNNELNFSFENTVKICEKMRVRDLCENIETLKEIIKLVSNKIYLFNVEKFFILMKLKILVNLLIEIQNQKLIEEFSNESLDEIKNDNCFNKIGKLLFLSKLTENGYLLNAPYMLSFNDSENIAIIKLTKLIDKFISDNNSIYNNFKDIIIYLNKYPILVKIVESIFPFYFIEKDKNKNLVILWIKLFYLLFSNKHYFTIIFISNNNEIMRLEFQNEKKEFSPIFKFSEEYPDFYLLNGSVKQYNENSKKYGKNLEFDFKKKKEKTTYFFYDTIYQLLEKKFEKPTTRILKKIYEKNKSIKNIENHLNNILKTIYSNNKIFDFNLFYKYLYKNGNIDNKINLGNIFCSIYSFSDDIKNYIINYINNDFSKTIFKFFNEKINNLSKNDFKEKYNLINSIQEFNEEIKKLSILNLYIENKINYLKNDDSLIIIQKLNNDLSILKNLKKILLN